MPIKQISNNIKFLGAKYRVKRRKNSERVINNNNSSVINYDVLYTIKFYTLYLPSSIKDVRLYSRSVTRGKENKILIKQSYLILIWLKYITLTNLFKDDKNSTGNNTSYSRGNSNDNRKVPSFFVYPCRLYKFTTIKSPMAHKTFSQEQFLCKNYRLSISFRGEIGNSNITNAVCVNNSLYFIAFFFQRMPSISTNMFLVQRFTLRFFSRDTRFFSLFFFK